MFTAELIKSLKQGALIEAGALFPGMSTEPIVYKVLHIKGNTWTLRAAYFNVFIGGYKAMITEDGAGVIITEAKL